MAYTVEVLGPSKRSVAGAMSHVYYAFGYMATSGLAYLLPDWRAFTIGVAATKLIVYATVGISKFSKKLNKSIAEKIKVKYSKNYKNK